MPSDMSHPNVQLSLFQFLAAILLICLLPSAHTRADEPFRLTYVRLAGLDTSLVANHILPQEIVMGLGIKRYYVVRTGSLNEAKKIISQYGVMGRTASGADDGSDDGFTVYPLSTASAQYMDTDKLSEFVRTSTIKFFTPYSEPTKELDIPDVEGYTRLFKQKRISENYAITYQPSDVGRRGDSVVIYGAELWRFLTPLDLSSFFKQATLVEKANFGSWTEWLTPGSDDRSVVNLLSYVSREGMPQDFIVVRGELLDSEPPPCESPPGIRFFASIPDMRMNALVFQNIADKPIDVNKFRYTEWPSMRLRQSSETVEALSGLAESESPLFPQKKLLPGEALLLPLNMYMTQLDDDRGRCLKSVPDRSAYGEAFALLQAAKKVYIAKKEPTFSVTAESVPPPTACPKPATYDYGPALRLKSVEVGGTWYPIRKFDSRLVNVLAGHEVGSCPFIFAYDALTDEYVNKGEILVGAVGKGAKRRERVEVTDSVGIRIWELQDETTFVDYAALVLVDDRGSEVVVLSDDYRLRWSDGEEVRLDKNDFIDLKFPAEKIEEVSPVKRFVEIEGHFVRRNESAGSPR